ncbi:MAG TPA: tetratricopeptide repeat protein [Acidobacteriota bacterium]|nr:tetratricopeptide repeat protein [Acidobacteriota bacterium]
MIRNARKQIRKFVGTAAVISMFCMATAFALQEKVSPLSDYQYKKDYAQYDTLKKEADLQKRADLIIGFVKEHPISKMLPYATSDYLECVKPTLAKNDFAKVISMLDAFGAVLPTAKSVQDAAIPAGSEDFLKSLLDAQKLIISSTAGVYIQSKNLPKAAETVEKLYDLAPDKATLVDLGGIYLKMQNFDKYLECGKKILAAFPMDQPQGYTTAIQMAQVYIQKQDVNSAIDLLSKVMDVYGDKVPPNTQEAQWNATRAFAYNVIASGIYAKKDYPKAQELYEKVAKIDPKNEDAYYFIGMCKWQAKDSDGAISAFAKCIVLNGQRAKRAQTNIEQLYKALHNNTLDGLDQVLAKAKSELGM